MILGPGARFSKVPVIDGPVNLRGLLSGPKLCFSKHTSTFPVLTGPEKKSGPLPDSSAGTSRSSAGERERVGTLFHSNHSLCASGLVFFLHFDSKDNGTRSKFNFEVVVVSKESNQSS